MTSYLKPPHECNCGKKVKRILVECENCTTFLRGINGRKYPINAMPVAVTQEQIDEWRNDGYTIVIKQPAYNA